MLSVQLEINSLSSYSASTLLNSTADLQVCYKCWNVLKLLMRSCFSQIWPSYQLGTVNRRFSNSIRLWFHTTAIAKVSAETKRTGTNQDVKHCETFPKSKEKASYVAKECEREISVCQKSAKCCKSTLPIEWILDTEWYWYMFYPCVSYILTVQLQCLSSCQKW